MHDTPSGGVICLLCGVELKRRTSARTHFRDKHLSGPSFRCPICGGVYKHENSFRSHISVNHKTLVGGIDVRACAVDNGDDVTTAAAAISDRHSFAAASNSNSNSDRH